MFRGSALTPAVWVFWQVQYFDEQYLAAAGLQYVEGHEFYPEEPLIASDVNTTAATDDSVEYSMDYSDVSATESHHVAQRHQTGAQHAVTSERPIYNDSWRADHVQVTDAHAHATDGDLETAAADDASAVLDVVSTASPQHAQSVKESTPKKTEHSTAPVVSADDVAVRRALHLDLLAAARHLAAGPQDGVFHLRQELILSNVVALSH